MATPYKHKMVQACIMKNAQDRMDVCVDRVEAEEKRVNFSTRQSWRDVGKNPRAPLSLPHELMTAKTRVGKIDLNFDLTPAYARGY